MPCRDKDALGVRAGYAVHAIECEPEVRAAQQVGQTAEVIDAPQQPQVVLHLIDNLSTRN